MSDWILALILSPFISSKTPSCLSVHLQFFFFFLSVSVCLSVFFSPPRLFLSSKPVHVSWSNSTDKTHASHPGDLNREASSVGPCSHDAKLCLRGSACALIIPSEQGCLLFFFFFFFFATEKCLCAFLNMCVCVCVCVCTPESFLQLSSSHI